MIKVNNLNKSFKINERETGLKESIKSLFNPKTKDFHAITDLSFEINKGEIVGFIGANGAGKSTTIKMLTGILTPTSGEIITNGYVPYENRKQNSLEIGVVFGQRSSLNWDLPFVESLLFNKVIYKLSDEQYQQQLEVLVEKLDLEELLKKPIRQMSLGQKMKCELAAACLHKPKILYLDEPTIGLDANVKEQIRNYIKQLVVEDDMTVVLTSHDMQDIELLADRIIIIDSGIKVFDDSLSVLFEKYGGKRKVKFTIDGEINLSNVIINKFDAKINDNEIVIIYDKGDHDVIDLINMISESNVISDFQTFHMPLEEIIKNIYIDGTTND